MSLFLKGYKEGFALWQWIFGCKQCRLKRGWHKLGCTNNNYPLLKWPFEK